MLSTYIKILLLSNIMGVFSAHLVVPGVLAAQQVLAILEGPALVHLEGPASLGDLGDQGHLQGDREIWTKHSLMMFDILLKMPDKVLWKHMAKESSFSCQHLQAWAWKKGCSLLLAFATGGW